MRVDNAKNRMEDARARAFAAASGGNPVKIRFTQRKYLEAQIEFWIAKRASYEWHESDNIRMCQQTIDSLKRKLEESTQMATNC